MESLHYKVAFTQFPLMLLTLAIVDMVNVVIVVVDIIVVMYLELFSDDVYFLIVFVVLTKAKRASSKFVWTQSDKKERKWDDNDRKINSNSNNSNVEK